MKGWRPEYNKAARNEPRFDEMIQRMNTILTQGEHVSKKDIAAMAYSFGRLQINHPAAIEVLKKACQLAQRVASQLEPQDMDRIAWGIASLNVRNEGSMINLMSIIAAEVVNKISEFNHRQLSNTAWAFAKCGLWNDQLVTTIAQECISKIETFSAQCLMNVSWAMAQWGTRNDELMTAISKEVTNKVAEFPPGSLAMTAWSFASLNVNNATMMDAVSRVAVEKIDEFKTDDLVFLAWAFANLRRQDQKLFEIMADRIKKSFEAAPGSTAPPELANVAWAFSKQEIPQEGLMRAIANEAAPSIHKFKPTEVAIITWAMAVAGVQNRELMAEIGASVSRTIDRFSAPQLSHIAWAFGALSMRHTELLQKLAGYVGDNLATFKVQGLSSIVWCFAMLGFRDEPLLMRVELELRKNVEELHPIAMARSVWAYKTLMIPCPDLMRVVAGEALRKVAGFPTKALVKLIDSVYVSPSAMSSASNLTRSLEDRTKSIADYLVSKFSMTDSLREVDLEDYAKEMTGLGLSDCGLVGTPLLLEQLKIKLPDYEFVESCRSREWLKDGKRQSEEGEEDRVEFAAAKAELTASGDRTLCEWVVNYPDMAESPMPDPTPTAPFQAVQLSGRSGRREPIFLVLCQLAARLCEWLGVEAMPLEASAAEACAGVAGTVKLLSTLVPCLSCVGALQQFVVLFPNVTLQFVEQVGAIRD